MHAMPLNHPFSAALCAVALCAMALGCAPEEGPVTFVFMGGIGWESEPMTEGFELVIADQATIAFDVTREFSHWESDEGTARLRYLPSWHSDVDSAGFFYLQVPAELLTQDQPLTLEVRSLGTGSKRWFAVDPIKDSKALETLLVEV